MTHKTFVQIDLETLSLKTGSCPVVSIGACAYNYEDRIFAEFYEVFDLNDQFAKGRVPEAGTLGWWLSQSSAATAPFTNADTRLTVDEMTDSFHEWWINVHNHINDDLYPLSNGANFDLAILENLFEAVPWNYKKTMCWRTISTIYKEHIVWDAPEVKHHALSDAKAQAKAHIKLMDKFDILR